MAATLLDLAVARLALGLVLREQFPAAASRALEDGLDSPSLRLLAGLSDAELDEATPLLHEAIVELGLPLPSKQAALVALSRAIARRILEGKLRPEQGAHEILWLWKNSQHPRVEELRDLLWNADAALGLGIDRRTIDRAIVDAAKVLVASE